MKLGIISPLLVICFSLLGCIGVSSARVDLDLLKEYFVSTPMQRDKIALKAGYELDDVWNYKGYSKGNVFNSRKNYEFIYYDEEENEWIGYITNNPRTIEGILDDVARDSSFLEKDGAYHAHNFSIEWKKTEVYGENVMLFVMRKV